MIQGYLAREIIKLFDFALCPWTSHTIVGEHTVLIPRKKIIKLA